jgi:hypothetical protein
MFGILSDRKVMKPTNSCQWDCVVVVMIFTYIQQQDQLGTGMKD